MAVLTGVLRRKLQVLLDVRFYEQQNMRQSRAEILSAVSTSEKHVRLAALLLERVHVAAVCSRTDEELEAFATSVAGDRTRVQVLASYGEDVATEQIRCRIEMFLYRTNSGVLEIALEQRLSYHLLRIVGAHPAA